MLKIPIITMFTLFVQWVTSEVSRTMTRHGIVYLLYHILENYIGSQIFLLNLSQ